MWYDISRLDTTNSLKHRLGGTNNMEIAIIGLSLVVICIFGIKHYLKHYLKRI